MTRPTVLVVAGHDPSGGAGIHADIEAIGAVGAHAATVVSALTCQTTRDVTEVVPSSPVFLARCIDALAEDMTFAAIKTGVLANAEQVEQVAALVAQRPDIPLVVDPVLVASGGGRLADHAVARALIEQLMPRATVVTPNLREAQALANLDTPRSDNGHECARALAGRTGHLLLTGGDDLDEGDPGYVVNRLFDAAGLIETYRWPRLPGSFHGSGCTLASTIAGLLATGHPLESAIATAQTCTWQTLANAYRVGRGAAIPARLDRAPQ